MPWFGVQSVRSQWVDLDFDGGLESGDGRLDRGPQTR